ncbi:hypothetical protein G4B88_005084 [Cannabis sativa]|jgi:hypothetical protein|uniref:Transmembrane protein 208 homolog n=1 Tax=Cannabis sativa TaxID=3483 RepID=A0A7J6H4H1_CANSA|nr:hypothetical protein G4B88_005084 [Cannabis sativa]
MANQGAKKRKEENSRHITNLRRLIIACNAIYFVFRMLIFHSSFTWKHWIGLGVTSAAYFLPYKQLDQMANPSYTDDGELLDGGFDMSTGGVCGYLHDIIYITSFVQVASIISGKFWYIYLVIPAFGVYQCSGFIKQIFSRGSEGDVEDEKSRKKREKLEKKASRGKFVKQRTR